MVRPIGTPCSRHCRLIGEQKDMMTLACQRPHTVEQSTPLVEVETVMPEYDPRTARQSRDHSLQIDNALIGHQPDSRERVAAAHGPLYSAGP